MESSEKKRKKRSKREREIVREKESRKERQHRRFILLIEMRKPHMMASSQFTA